MPRPSSPHDPDKEPVFCESCDHIHPESVKGKRSYYAMCIKFPRDRSEMGFVTRTGWDLDPPYYFCRKINHDGHCPHFTQRS